MWPAFSCCSNMFVHVAVARKEFACVPLRLPRLAAMKRQLPVDPPMPSSCRRLGPNAVLLCAQIPHLAAFWEDRPTVQEAISEAVQGRRKRTRTRRDTTCLAMRHPKDCSLALVAIVNVYKKGDLIHHHHDDEPQVRQDLPIHVYSFGQSADFQVRKSTGSEDFGTLTLRTKTGQRLTMLGRDFQRDFTHGLPDRLPRGTRISVTVRHCAMEAMVVEAYDFSKTSLDIQWCDWKSVAAENANPELVELVRACCANVAKFGTGAHFLLS